MFPLLAKQVAVITKGHSLCLRKNDISEMPVRSRWQERVSLSCCLTWGYVCVSAAAALLKLQGTHHPTCQMAFQQGPLIYHFLLLCDNG